MWWSNNKGVPLAANAAAMALTKEIAAKKRQKEKLKSDERLVKRDCLRCLRRLILIVASRGEFYVTIRVADCFERNSVYPYKDLVLYLESYLSKIGYKIKEPSWHAKKYSRADFVIDWEHKKQEILDNI